MTSPIPLPQRITVTHAKTSTGSNGEPGVDIIVDALDGHIRPGGKLKMTTVSTHTSIPMSNDEPGRPAIDAVPGSGIVVPGGAHIFYLDFAPGAQNPMHRTLSTDYVVVMKGTLTVLAPPPAPFDVTDEGKATYAETVEAVAREGDVVVQRGSLHTWANRTDEWVRLLCVVLASDPVKVGGKELGELWLN